MERKGESLAARLRAALDADEAERARSTAAREERLAEARAARERLLDDLAAFGEAVGHLAVQRDADGVTLRRGDRFLRFEPLGEADRVRVSLTGDDTDSHRLYREPMLRDRWVWTFERHGRPERLPLFDSGLEELLVLALELPRVTGTDAPPEAPRPAPGPRPARKRDL